MALYGNCSSGRSSSTHNHKEVNFMIFPFKLLEEDESMPNICQVSPFLHPFIKNLPVCEEPLEWSSVSMIFCYVRDVLKSVTLEVDFKPGLKFFHELGLFENERGDIWIVTINGAPIGVVAVKKPFNPASGRSVMNDKNALGQLFDYVTHLQFYTGRQHAFGILTTYHEWRFVWLPDSNDIASSTAITHIDHSKCYQSSPLDEKPVPNLSPSLPEVSREFAEPAVSVTEHSTLYPERLLHVSDIFQYNNPMLPRLILSLIKKMKSSPVLPSSVKSSCLFKHMPYIYVNDVQEKWHWRKPKNTIPLMFDGPMPAVRAAYLLLDLGGGGDGRVWLAATPQGKVCVLKFYEDKELAVTEQKLWKEIWNIEVKITTFIGQSVLVMPWLKTCLENMEEGVKVAVKEAVERFANSGYHHDDLHLRHVGLYKEGTGRLRAILFDLAHTSKINESPSSAITSMMHDLHISQY